MGGLQHKLIDRSKKASGHGVVFLKGELEHKSELVQEFLKEKGISSVAEYEIELLMQNGKIFLPVIIHGVDPKGVLPPFLEDKPFTELVLPRDIAIKVGGSLGDLLRLISPAHTDGFMGDIPRTTSLYVDYMVRTDVPEVDLYHAWADLKRIQNLIRSRSVNRLRFYQEHDFDELRLQLKQKFGEQVVVKTWEDQNNTLVWALALESTVMIFLFVSMTLLVSLCITSGLLIFFGKVRTDMASFWIMGGSKKSLDRGASWFLWLMGIVSVGTGLGMGLLFLFILDKYGLEIMPAVFVDRKIPVRITTQGLLVSFLVPFVISTIFSFFSLRSFKKDTDFLELVRSVGT